VVDSTVPEDPLGVAAVAAFKKPLEAIGRTVISQTSTGYDGSRETVRKQESPMANIVADAMLAGVANSGAQMAFINGGGVRAGIDAGAITYEEAIQVQPFNNTLVVMDLTGDEIMKALEYGVSGLKEGQGRFLQVSKGFNYAFDPDNEAGRRVLSASLNGQPIDPAKTYKVVMNNFMAVGGDGFEVFKNAKGARLSTGILDVDVLIDYLRKNPNLPGKVEGRIDIRHRQLGLMPEWLTSTSLCEPKPISGRIIQYP
jgi:5'-nucleotidase / UDP-sugar diphosphatase